VSWIAEHHLKQAEVAAQAVLRRLCFRTRLAGPGSGGGGIAATPRGVVNCALAPDPSACPVAPEPAKVVTD
jgi:hypothetical protein